MRTSWLLTLTCHEVSYCKYELLMSAKNCWLYNTVAMEMFVVFNIPPFCTLDSFATHLFRVFVHLNTIKKQGLSRDLRSPSAIFCLVQIEINWRKHLVSASLLFSYVRPVCVLQQVFYLFVFVKIFWITCFGRVVFANCFWRIVFEELFLNSWIRLVFLDDTTSSKDSTQRKMSPVFSWSSNSSFRLNLETEHDFARLRRNF